MMRYLLVESNAILTRATYCATRSFSRTPSRLRAPGSLPPCPASSTTTGKGGPGGVAGTSAAGGAATPVAGVVDVVGGHWVDCAGPDTTGDGGFRTSAN